MNIEKQYRKGILKKSSINAVVIASSIYIVNEFAGYWLFGRDVASN